MDSKNEKDRKEEMKMKKMFLLELMLVGLLVLCFMPVTAQAYDNLLVIYTSEGGPWIFTFGNSDARVNWDIQGDARISLNIDASGYEHKFYSEGDSVAGSLTASCTELTQRATVQNGIIYAITDASGTLVEISFEGSYASILEHISVDDALQDCHVYIQLELSGQNIWLEVVDGQIVPPPAPPAPPRPTLAQMKACGIMMMRAQYGFSRQFAKFIEGEFSILTIDRAMRDAGDNPNEFLVALYGYSLQELRIQSNGNLIVFTFYIGNNFTKTFMPKNGFMKVNPGLTVARVTEEGKDILDDLIGLDSNPDIFLVSEFNEETRKFRIMWDISALKPGHYELYLGNFYQDWPPFQMFFGEPAPNGKIPFEINTFPVPVNQ